MVYQQFDVFQNAATGFNQHQYAHAATFLRDGAIGVGEDHRVLAGRHFATTLINRRLVRNLFLEGKSSAQGELDTAVMAARQSRTLERRRISLEHLKSVVDDAGPQYESLPVSLGDVAVMAYGHDVNIHLIDLDRVDEIEFLRTLKDRADVVGFLGENKDKVIEFGSLGTYERVALRDLYAAREFSRITERTETVGSLVLYGAVHLMGSTHWYRNNAKCLGELLELTSFLAAPEVLPAVPRERARKLVRS